MKHVLRMALVGAMLLFLDVHGATAGSGQVRLTGADGPIITEFLASNDKGLLDKDHESSDWIEINNPTGRAIDLDGWYLSDDINDLEKWEFPSVVLPPGGYLVVFASGRDEREVGGELQPNIPEVTVVRQKAKAKKSQVGEKKEVSQ